MSDRVPRCLAILMSAVAAFVALAAVTPAGAAAAPLYVVKATWGPTNLPPGGDGQFTVQARNVGDAPSSEAVVVSNELPEGAVVSGIHFMFDQLDLAASFGWCSGVGTRTASCEIPESPFLAILTGPRSDAAERPTGYLPVMFVETTVEPSATGQGTNTATVTEGGAPHGSDVEQVPFSAAPSAFGIVPGSYEADIFDAKYPAGNPSRTAGDHPYEQRVNFDLKSRIDTGNDGTRETVTVGAVKTVEVTLPRGMVGNPEALPKCDPQDFATPGAYTQGSTSCPPETQVGTINLQLINGGFNYGRGTFANLNELLTRVAIYNLEPPKGVPADFGFTAGGIVQAHIYPELDPAQNYAIKTVTPNISSLMTLRGTEVTFWGVPGDPSHDKLRYFTEPQEGRVVGAPFGAAPRPLLTNPMDCGFDNGGARIRAESYNDPGKFTPVEEWSSPLNVDGCDDPRVRFEPAIEIQPTSRDAGGPTGLNVHLEVAQRNDVANEAKELYASEGFAKGVSTPPMKKAVVTFPEGMTVNPAAASGLGSCSSEQIGLGTNAPVRCPDNSQYGTLTLHTPILPVDEQPEGFVYIAKQNDNPFHNFLSLYLVIQEPERGILVKVPGRVDLDPRTGQITTTFDDLPQFPLSDMEMRLKSGVRAGLVNPQTCGSKTIEATFYPWSDPSTPHHVSSSYEITRNPDGSPCHGSPADRPFDPSLSGGTVSSLAGSFSPLELRMTRSDEDQELLGVEGTAPPGLLASLKGVARCSDAAIAAAANPARTGAEEEAGASCPRDSLVGTVDAGAGVGQVLTYVKGKIYLAGPYKGAPLSGVAIVPAVAGPFDLGVIVTRAPAYVDPKTARLTLKTDPLPQIFKGVPVRVRDIQVHVDRPHFTLNPTSCEPFSLTGTLLSTEGKSKQDGSRFQATECRGLGFGPKLFTRLFGGTKRGAHPKFRGVFRAREGDANVGGAVVTLPRSEFLDQAHIGTVCTRVQFAAGGGHGEQCPAASVYGHAVARTPLLDEPLSGPVFLRSSNHQLPDLVVALRGIIDVEVSARVDSVRGGIRASFESVPDAPVSSFAITMQGGRKGLLINSRDICDRSYRIGAAFVGQNGKEATLRPELKANCGKARGARAR